MNKMTVLEEFLRQTKADQGGECTFEEWLEAVAEDENEFAHEEALEFQKMRAALSAD